MKKLFFMAAICFVLAFGVLADKVSTEHSVTVNVDAESGTVKAQISVSSGDGIVGHFGIKYNTEKLTLVHGDLSPLPENIPAKDENEKDYISKIVVPSESFISVIYDSATPDKLISTEKGMVMFAWYAASGKTVSAGESDGKIAEISFKIPEGVSADSIKAEDFGVVTAEDCADIKGWTSGILVQNSDSKLFALDENTGAEVLKVDIKLSETKDAPDVNDEPDPENSENKDESGETEKEDGTGTNENNSENSDEKEETGGSVTGEKEDDESEKYAKINIQVHENGDRFRFVWEKPDVEVFTYRVCALDEKGNTVKSFDGIVDITKSYTLKGLPAGFVFYAVVEAYDAGGNKIAVSEKTQFKVPDSVLSVIEEYTVKYDAGEGRIYGAVSETVDFGNNCKNIPTVKAPDGYVFKGWSKDGINLVDTDELVIYGNTVLVAVYEKDIETI